MRGISNIWTELSIPPSPLPIGTSSRKEKAGSRSKAAVAELPSTGSRLQILLSSPELLPPNPSIASRKQIFRRRRGPTTAVVNSCAMKRKLLDQEWGHGGECTVVFSSNDKHCKFLGCQNDKYCLGWIEASSHRSQG